MNTQQLERICSTFGINLPASYRDFQLQYPESFDQDIRDHDIYDDPDRVIKETNFLRSSDFIPGGWPKNYLVIGDSGCGDWYYLDIATETGQIGCWDHEEDGFSMQQTDINEFAEEIRCNP